MKQPTLRNQPAHAKDYDAAAAFSNLTAGCDSIHSIEHLCPRSSLILLHPVIIIVGLKRSSANQSRQNVVPLQAQSPAMDFDFLWKPHCLEHFRSEHARISNLYPFIQMRMESKDFKRWFRIRIISRFETKVFQSYTLSATPQRTTS